MQSAFTPEGWLILMNYAYNYDNRIYVGVNADWWITLNREISDNIWNGIM